MGRFAELPKAGFVAQNAQPGVVFRAALGVGFEKIFQPGDGFGAAIDVAQVTHQGKLRFAGLRETRDGEAADFEGNFVIPALPIGVGKFQADRDVVGFGSDLFAQDA